MKTKKIISLPEGGMLSSDAILYISMNRNYAAIHISGGRVLEARVTMAQLEDMLGPGFVKIHRSTLVSVRAIHDVTDTVNLCNGEKLNYVKSKKEEIIKTVKHWQQKLLVQLPEEDLLNGKSYREHYRVFDDMPIAFADIEMIFDEQRNAVDWIFRYGNPALAVLEKKPLDSLVGAAFSGLFANMDAKWLRVYERSALFGETLEIMDYSPEIDTYLKVISFPTFPGHCGCFLFDISMIQFSRNCSDAERALLLYLGQMAK